MIVCVYVYSQVTGKRMNVISSNMHLPSLIKDTTYQGQAMTELGKHNPHGRKVYSFSCKYYEV